MSEDPRLAAARYRMRKDLGPDAEAEAEAEAAASEGPSRGSTAAERAAFVEVSIQQAIRRGEFDDLPGAGKPLEGLGDRYDPDWWIRRKIEREQLRGLGPPAITLRTEDRELDARLDAIPREAEVREVLEDFNLRVREARRQLLGGPPVVTPLRDVEAELDAWRARRAARDEARRAAAEAEAAERRRRPWWRRRG
ncbi:DnaJ family domain-containing protein [Microbacterium sp. GXF7504]